jgi:peptidoglycan-associated lipoprotein
MRRHAMIALLVLGAAAACGPSYPKCLEDEDCKKHNEYCVNGQCQQCRGDKDCQAGEKCNKGRCEHTAAVGCSDDAQCPAGQSCIDGACKPCASDGECGPGGKCNAGRCTRAPLATGGDENPPLPAGACQLEPVYFDFNESVLSTEATAAIDRNATCMKKITNRKITLVGHTDPRGTEEYNLALSDHRALSVKERLARVGVEAGRLKTVGKGELEATGTDESGWAKDRRVDVQW